uniref:Uncharacterized protein n=1 Tax=Caenorhabditis japonica TaxID=281687 RepID=A0A8R1EA54_CAEJA
MPPVNPEVRTSAARQDDSSAPMQVSSGSFPTALLECAQRRKPADHVRKHPQSPPSSPMSSASRKKRPKDPDSPTTEKPNDQVQFSPGRHTDVAHEDELVLAADGPENPLRDTPASSLATAAGAPASFENTNTDSIPVSTPVNNSGHPSAVSSSSQMSTHDAKTAAAQRLIRQWEDDYDIEVDVSDQKEENPPPPPEEEPEETYAPEFDFTVPTIIHGVQVPAKQRYHPFHGFHAVREGEERHKRLVATIVLSQVHSFRVRTVQSFQPIEKPTIIREAQFPVKQKRHQFDNAPCEEEYPPKDVTKLLVTYCSRSSSKFQIEILGKVNTNGRAKDTSARSSRSRPRTRGNDISHTVCNLRPTRAPRILSRFATCSPTDRSQQPTGPTIRPHLSTIYTGKHTRDICHSFTSDCPDTIDVPQNFASTGDTPSSGKFHRATILIRKSTSFTAAEHQSRCS